eukprot:3713272-Amphidinium_carterae.1
METATSSNHGQMSEWNSQETTRLQSIRQPITNRDVIAGVEGEPHALLIHGESGYEAWHHLKL